MLIQKLLLSCNDPSIDPLSDIALLLFLEFFSIFALIFEIYSWIIPFPSLLPKWCWGETPQRDRQPRKTTYGKIPLRGRVPWASLPPPPKLALQGNAGHQVFIAVFCQRIVVQPYRTRVLEQVECAGVGPRAENKVLVSAGGLWSGCFFLSPLFSLFHVKSSLLVVYDNTCS